MLTFHLFEHNFGDTLNPLRPIHDRIENMEHFYLLCYTHDEDRRDLLNSVDAILRPHGVTHLSKMKIYSKGHEQPSFDSETKILKATLKNIKASEWFQ